MDVAVKCADVDALPYLSLDLRPRSVRGERETESKSGTTRSPSAVSRIHRHLHRRLLSILLSRVQYLLLHVPRARISDSFRTRSVASFDGARVIATNLETTTTDAISDQVGIIRPPPPAPAAVADPPSPPPSTQTPKSPVPVE